MYRAIIFIILSALIVGNSQANEQVINRGNGAEVDSLNPHLSQGLNSQNILLDLYEGLMTFDINAQPIYAVAQTHQVNHNHTEWTFMLKPEAKWSDGSPVTAADFIRSWQSAVDPLTAAPYRQLFDNFVTKNKQLAVTSDHPHHLKIELKQPDAGLLSKLVLPVFAPIHLNKQDLPISNGAYYLSEWRLQERVTLTKNPYFHAASEVLTDTINYWVTENQNTELLRFRAGELDITETIPDNKINWLRDNLSDELRIYPYYGTFFLGLNLNDRHLNDIHLRRALSLAIDRQVLVDKVLKSGQVPANQIVPNTQNPSDDNGLDLDLARVELKQSHFRVATDRLEILYNSSHNQKKVALAVAAMWRQHLGIKTKLRNQEWKVFVNTRKGHNKQVFRSGWIADYYDPLNFLELFLSDSHFNFYGFTNPQYDHLVAQLKLSAAAEKRTLIQQAEDILKQELPVIPLYHYVSRHLVSTRILGFENNEMDRHLSRYLAIKSP